MRRVAFIKRSGLSTGGTEKWLQYAAIALSRNRYDVTFFYSDENVDVDRFKLLRDNNVSLQPFTIGKISDNSTSDWITTDFWDYFHEDRYDIIQTAKYGPSEYPYFLFKKKFVEKVAFATSIDKSVNRIHTVTPSKWLMNQWIKSGGDRSSVSTIPVPVNDPQSLENLRDKLSIPADAIVAGFHQRSDDNIFSYIPLSAFKRVETHNKFFLIMGGSKKYVRQAESLGLRNVIFIPHSGSERSVSEFLNTLDFFSHGRRDGETFGTVFAEAQMHGLASLSHRSHLYNAHIETISNTGIVAYNLIDYTWHLRRLYADSSLRSRLARNSCFNAFSRYSYASFESQILVLYDSIYRIISQ